MQHIFAAIPDNLGQGISVGKLSLAEVTEILSVLDPEEKKKMCRTKYMFAPTLMHGAAMRNDCTLAELLNDIDTNLVSDRTTNSLSPLCLAMTLGHADFVRFLLNHGALANEFWLNGLMPLHYACAKKEEGMIESLLEKISSVRMCVDGYGALFLALSDEQHVQEPVEIQGLNWMTLPTAPRKPYARNSAMEKLLARTLSEDRCEATLSAIFKTKDAVALDRLLALGLPVNTLYKGKPLEIAIKAMQSQPSAVATVEPPSAEGPGALRSSDQKIGKAIKPSHKPGRFTPYDMLDRHMSPYFSRLVPQSSSSLKQARAASQHSPSWMDSSTVPGSVVDRLSTFDVEHSFDSLRSLAFMYQQEQKAAAASDKLSVSSKLLEPDVSLPGDQLRQRQGDASSVGLQSAVRQPGSPVIFRVLIPAIPSPIARRPDLPARTENVGSPGKCAARRSLSQYLADT
ncbi:MAG: ankyrin repeat domain-containing protein [Pseudomonadota bacterium]